MLLAVSLAVPSRHESMESAGFGKARPPTPPRKSSLVRGVLRTQPRPPDSHDLLQEEMAGREHRVGTASSVRGIWTKVRIWCGYVKAVTIDITEGDASVPLLACRHLPPQPTTSTSTTDVGPRRRRPSKGALGHTRDKLCGQLASTWSGAVQAVLDWRGTSDLRHQVVEEECLDSLFGVQHDLHRSARRLRAAESDHDR